MFLNKITVQNFRLLRDFSVDLEQELSESKGHFYELFFALSLPSSVFPNINLKCKLNLYE